ncbi:MAG: SpvB/TcaC N-terminal domain-containing protein, partial [Alphaproteobacteria bacterium]
NQTGANADAVLDGLETTGWSPASAGGNTSAPYHNAELQRMTALDKLRLQISGTLTGTVGVDALTKSGWQTIAEAIPAASLTEGWNTIALGKAEASALRIRFMAADNASRINELQISGSPVGSPAASPRLTVSYPDNGQYYGDMAYVRGFAEPVRNGSGRVRIVVAGKPVPSEQGAFEASVSKADLGIDSAATDWSVDVEAIYPDGKRVKQKVTFNAPVNAERRDQIDASLNALFTDVVPGHARAIRHLGAAIELSADAIKNKTRILMQPLRDVDMPKLDPGMINVTRGNFKGFRFLPHGQHFKRAVKVKLPFDKTKLPSGMTTADIKTYFFDTTLGHWQPLEKAAVTAEGEVASLTTHFTDMINAVVQAPDSPQTASFNPTQIKDLKLANPSAGVNLIAPPQANSMGDVRLSYPLELTPGRVGMTPQLGLTYNSAGGNGWLGVGWDLAVSSVSIDTRWGVPRYDTSNETETYIVDGEQLAPVAHRGALVARTADKTFHTRVEGGFRRIIRHGNSPTNYWWEVKDKSGASYFYGGDPSSNGPLDEATLKDASGNIFSWALREARDSNGNIIRYRYVHVSDSGTNDGGSAAAGTELYLKTVEYTGREGEAGKYVVTLTRASELGEDRRPDATIDARGGFKRVTADLLRKIKLTYGGASVRSYELTYKTGAFSKTLLDKVKQFDANDQLFNEHEFSYFDEARDDGGLYKGFDSARETWNTGTDNVEGNGLLGNLDASALSGHESRSVGGHLYVGVGLTASKSNSVGAKTGYTTGSGDGLLALVDINGDGLQDKVFRQGATTSFGPKTLIAGLPAISHDESSSTSVGPEAYPSLGIVGGFVGVNWMSTDTRSSVYFSDVNGDGLVDLVNNGGVLFNHIDASGKPVFTADSSDTPYPIGSGAIASGLLSDELQAVYERENAANPKIDSVRRWIAPFSGAVTISGDVALIEDTTPERADYTTADGVRVAIQHGANELWSETIAATDYTPKTPSVGSLTVAKGDILYFRVQSVDDGAYDQVNWAPVITYTGVPAATDANNLNPYTYDSSTDLTLIALRPTTVNMPYNGTVSISGTLNKAAATSDDAILEVLKDGAVLATQTIPAAATGAFSINQSTNVLKDEFDANGNQTQTATRLSIRLRIDSRIDLNQFSWGANAAPTIAYTASPDLDPGAPLPTTEAPVSADLYPESNLITAPLPPWTAPSAGTYTFEAEVQGGSGSVVLTAKSAGERLAKHTVNIGSVQNFSLTLDAGQQVYFEFHGDHATGSAVTQARVRRVVGGAPQDPALASALYYASSADILPQRYRGWNAFGYNGNLDAATQPIQITADDLTLSHLGSVDRTGYQSDLEDAVNNGTDPTVDTSAFTLRRPRVVGFGERHERLASGQELHRRSERQPVRWRARRAAHEHDLPARGGRWR